MSNSVISNCSCENNFQDKRYGKGKRVFNLLKKDGDREPKGRCTVCGSVKSVKD